MALPNSKIYESIYAHHEPEKIQILTIRIQFTITKAYSIVDNPIIDSMLNFTASFLKLDWGEGAER